ncbi:MAG: phosphodiesterase [Clostridiales bacterium]|jgi:putative phosphoesterase|nr:phosphodiesterase [Clostridiales bacterium]
MKFLIASDLHGSGYYCRLLLDKFSEEGADHLILLGDIYYHGPRNPLPAEYNPQKVAGLLNGIVDRLTVIKGNCDSDVDTLVSDFDFVPSVQLVVDGARLFLTHGDKYDKDNLPKNAVDALIYGHYHVGFIEKRGSLVIANPGSAALPKDGRPSYLLLDGRKLYLKDFKGNVVDFAEIGR